MRAAPLMLVTLAMAWTPDATAQESESGASESDPQASPDVQSQVGVGTEKEEEKPAASDEGYEPTPPFAQAESQRRKQTYGHGGQAGLRVGGVFPYRVLGRFDDSPLCSTSEADPDPNAEPAKTCGFPGPPELELALSFALANAFEPFVWSRLGLSSEDQTNTAPRVLLGAGARIYTMSEPQFKLFFEASAAVQLEGARRPELEQAANYGNDVFARIAFGPQYDFGNYFGLFASVGIGSAFMRGITGQVEAAIGLQGRLP